MKNIIFNTQLSPLRKYQLNFAALLSLVPVLCTVILIMLVMVFAKLNLYYLESLGLLINPAIREAYYTQVLIEVAGVLPFLVTLYVLGICLCAIVMNWAIAPFKSAEKQVEQFKKNPNSVTHGSKWISESASFDKAMTVFFNWVQNGTDTSEVKTPKEPFINLPFLGKFLFIFTIVSISTGYTMGIILNSIYDKIVSLAVQLISGKEIQGHYFLAQEAILSDGVKIMMILAFILYTVIGIKISRYMATLIFVLTRAIKEKRFPLQLRSGDPCQHLADEMSALVAAKK